MCRVWQPVGSSERNGCRYLSSWQRAMARLPPLCMMNDRDDVRTFRGLTEIPYFGAMSMNMRPNQSSAMVVMRSGAIDNLAQQKAAVTAFPPNEIAYEEATCFSSPTGNRSVRNVTSI